MKYFHKITQKSFELLRCRYCISLVASTCNQKITLITLHTTLIPTRKLNGNTLVHTVFYLDSFGQEMPSLVLVKVQYSHSCNPFRLLLVDIFSTRVTRLRLVPRPRKLKCGWVVIISIKKLGAPITSEGQIGVCTTVPL
jgi:hypothetical protein